MQIPMLKTEIPLLVIRYTRAIALVGPIFGSLRCFLCFAGLGGKHQEAEAAFSTASKDCGSIGLLPSILQCLSYPSGGLG